MTALSEKRVVEIWDRVAGATPVLTTIDNREVHVLYAGRPSDEPGCDFCDAVLNIDGEIRKGNIEVHVSSGDWQQHRHHRDETYNGVVLHVVMNHQGGVATLQANGVKVPIVALENIPPEKSVDMTLCRVRRLNGIAQTQRLDREGSCRFQEKILEFRRLLSSTDGGQALYRGLMGALGYTRNKNTFQLLADRLRLEAVAPACGGGSGYLEALFLGTAGFLPSQRITYTKIPSHHPYVHEIESIWKNSGHNQLVSYEDWRLYRLRPANHPARRLVAMALLLWSCREKGLLSTLMEAVVKIDPNKCHQPLETIFTVVTDGYWEQRYDFDRVARGLQPCLIGRGRASEMTVNVLLPFTCALGEHTGQATLAEKASTLFNSYPAGEDNTIERHIRKQLNIGKALISTARRQQGLLHLYKHFCTQGKCRECLPAE